MDKPLKRIRTIITIFIVLIACSRVIAQSNPDKQADSLQAEINKHPAKDSVQARLKIKLGSLILRKDPAMSMKLTDEALEISKASHWEFGIYTSLRQQGAVYLGLGEFNKAISAQLQAQKEIEQDNTVSDVERKKFLIGVYINIANAYTGVKDFDKSIEYGFKALPLIKELKQDYLSGVAYLDIGLTYLDKGDLDKADKFLDSSYYVASKFNYMIIKPIYFNNKGEVQTKRGNNQQAIEQFRKAIIYADSLDDIVTKVSSLSSIGEAYVFLKNYPEAAKYTQQGLALAEKAQLLQREFEDHELLSRIYEHENKPAEALQSYKKYIALRDSSIGEEKKVEMSRREMKFEADKKDALSEAEIGRQKIIKNTITIGAIVLLIFGIAIFFAYKKRRDTLQRQSELEFNAQVADVKMKVLRLQLNPHFIFNSLNSISNYISKNDTKSADYFLAKFAKLMRSTLENSEEKEISLTDELKMIELYIQLEAARMNNKFTYQIDVAKDIDPDTTFLPPLILQPFVENSIWHGLAEKEGSGHILIEITRENALLNCVVADDGVGRSASSNPAKKSFGLKITSERIALINKLKKTNASIHLVDLEKGTRVEIKLPFETAT